jgi:hypothetical protein
MSRLVRLPNRSSMGATLLAASAYGAGFVFGQLLILTLVGFGIWRLGVRFKVNKALRIVSVVVIVGFVFVASQVGNAKSSVTSDYPCTAIGMTRAQEDLVKQVVAKRFPRRAVAATTAGGYAFCAVMSPSIALAFHTPIAKIGQRATSRMILHMGSIATASQSAALIKSDPHRFLTLMAQGTPIPATEHVTAVRSVTTCVIVTISQIRRN